MPSDSACSAPRGRRPALLRATVAAATTLLTAGLTVALMAGCGTSAPGSGAPGSTGSGSADPGGRASVTVARDDANGTTIHLRVGGRLELRLSSTYWSLRPSSAPAVLRRDGGVRVLPRPSTCSNLPGLGCAPIEAMFTAIAPGTAVITATRTTCGEALACRPDQTRFAVIIVVR